MNGAACIGSILRAVICGQIVEALTTSFQQQTSLRLGLRSHDDGLADDIVTRDTVIARQ